MVHKKVSAEKKERVIDSQAGRSWIQYKEECMYLLAWIFIGVVVGWAAGRVLQGESYGRSMDILMGVGGAVAGGFLMRSAGFGGYGGAIVTTMVALIGAVLLTVLTAYVNGRRLYARQL